VDFAVCLGLGFRVIFDGKFEGYLNRLRRNIDTLAVGIEEEC